MIHVGIIGATGYVGAELVRLLARHPKVKRLNLSSVSFEGQQMQDVYPNLAGCIDIKLVNADSIVDDSDVIFTALPHGVAEQYAAECLKKGKKLIDMSADFRFDDDEATFTKWYKESWKYPAVHAESVYGLPEMNRKKIAKARIIGNPGCYVTSATLALLPAIENGLIKFDPIIVDSKSGVTGTGRNPSIKNQFCECGESISPYAVGAHRHQPEIERNLSIAAGEHCGVVFTPHLVPMSRGIVSTVYAQLNDTICEAAGAEINSKIIQRLYSDFYANEPFVRVLPTGMVPTTKNVRYSNYCDISVHVVHDGRMLEICSALDNMLKGAAGQAVQNMNIMFGYKEDMGIDMIPPAF